MSWDLLRSLLGINSDNTGGEDVTAKDAIVKYVETYGTSRTRDIIDSLIEMGWSENTVSQELANLNGGPIYSPRRGVYAINTDYEPEPTQSRETVEDTIRRYIDKNGVMDKYAVEDIARSTGYSHTYIWQAAGRMVRENELERDHYLQRGRQGNRRVNYYKNPSAGSDKDDEEKDESGSKEDPGCWDLI